MRGYLRLFISLILMLFALCSCSGDSVQQDPLSQLMPPGIAPDTDQQDLGSGLPAFGSLSAHAATGIAAYTNGCDYQEEMPHPLVEQQGVMAVFRPDWDPAGSGSRELAYALYSIHHDSLEIDPILRLWFSRYGNSGDLNVALGNHVTQTWDWQEVEWYVSQTELRINFDPTEYLSPENNLTVLVVFTGTDPWWLTGLGVELGEPVTAAQVSAPTLTGPAGTEITIRTVDVVGTPPYTFHWDFGAAASPPMFDDPEPTITVTGEPGEYTCRVYIDNEFGEPYVHEFPLAVTGDIDGWSTVIRPASEGIGIINLLDTSIEVPSDDSSLIASTSIIGQYYSIALQKYDSDGGVEYLRNWQAGQDLRFRDMALASDGNALILGQTDTGNYIADKALLIKSDAEGNPLWSINWNWELINSCLFYDICAAADGTAYLAGSGTVPGMGCGVVVKTAADGSISWAKRYGIVGKSMHFSRLATDSTGGLVAAGWLTDYSGGNSGVAVVRFDADGALEWDMLIPFDTDTPDIAGLAFDNDENLIMVLERDWCPVSPPDLILKFDPHGNFLGGLMLEVDPTEVTEERTEFNDIVVDPASGRLFLVGALHTSGYPKYSQELLLVAIDTDLSPDSIEARCWGTQEAFQDGLGIALDSRGRVMATGTSCNAVSGLIHGYDATCSVISSIDIETLAGAVDAFSGTVVDYPGSFVDVAYATNQQISPYIGGGVVLRYDGF